MSYSALTGNPWHSLRHRQLYNRHGHHFLHFLHHELRPSWRLLYRRNKRSLHRGDVHRGERRRHRPLRRPRRHTSSSTRRN